VLQLEMSVANYDGSDVTRFRKARALYAYKSANQAAVQASLSQQPYQGPPPLADVVTNTNLGGPNLVRDGCIIHAGCGCAPTITCQGDPAPVGGQ